jgi:hypothetical protein
MRAWLRELWHRLEHWRGANTGDVVTWFSRDRRLMVAYFCHGCGQIRGMHAMGEPYRTAERGEPRR